MAAGDFGLDGAGRALFGLVRFWARRWIVGGSDAGDQGVQHILAAEAVAAAARQGAAPVTVNDVAHQLGVDQSNASRLVARAVAAGVLGKARSPRDGRSAALSLTEHGEALLAASWAHQEDAFRSLVAHWDPADQARLAAYLKALAAGTPPHGR